MLESIEEQGVVVELKGHQAKVQMKENPACESCAGHGACHAIGSIFGKRVMVMEALNPEGAQVGQQVIVSFKSEQLPKASFIIFIIPVAGLLAGAILGYCLNVGGNRDISSLIFGILGVTLTFLAIKQYCTRYDRDTSYRPTIIKVVG